ncbi:MAG: carotenoid oxygenase family protein [Novosphingobium sp.]
MTELLDRKETGYLDSAYGENVYAPVECELSVPGVTGHGNIPRDINGIFVQATPNPAYPPGPGHSWFDGDGMIQSVEIIDGAAHYRNRWVQTKGLLEDREAGRATYIGSLAKQKLGKRHKNTANTDLVWHAGRLLALWWEGGEPYELSLPSLETVGTYDYGGTLDIGLTSHCKVDPKTGELFFIAWATRAPYLTLGVATEDGRIARKVAIELAGPRVQHDMGLSDRSVAVFDFPLAIDPEREGTALGFKMVDQPSRIGLLSRDPADDVVQWFEVEPCYMWHLMCCYDDGDDFVVIGVRSANAANYDSTHEVDDRPTVDGEHRFDTLLHEWRLNRRTGVARERDVDNVLAELPRVNDAYVSSGASFGYAGLLDEKAETFRFKGIAKYDLKTYERKDIFFPDGWVCNEPNFVPADKPQAEDDGYVVAFVTDTKSLATQFWIIRADEFEKGPVARLELPQRVPAGFHGRWIPRSTYAG